MFTGPTLFSLDICIDAIFSFLNQPESGLGVEKANIMTVKNNISHSYEGICSLFLKGQKKLNHCCFVSYFKENLRFPIFEGVCCKPK